MIIYSYGYTHYSPLGVRSVSCLWVKEYEYYFSQQNSHIDLLEQKMWDEIINKLFRV
jgi:hypothetical protein